MTSHPTPSTTQGPERTLGQPPWVTEMPKCPRLEVETELDADGQLYWMRWYKEIEGGQWALLGLRGPRGRALWLP